MTYTWSALTAAVLVVFLDVAVLRTALVRRRAFWVAYVIVLFFQLVVNGVLTGLRIVRYDPARILGVRFVFAPLEDLLFGFALVTLTLCVWVWTGRRGVAAGRPAPVVDRPARPSRDAAGRRGRDR